MDYGWNWITDRIALGGEIQFPSDVHALQTGGVTHVINCREICDPRYSEDVLTTCWPNPRQPDDGKPRGLVWFLQGLDFWWVNIAFKRIGNIYVHCHAGMERSHAMVIALLMAMGLTFADAMALTIRHRPLGILGVRYLDEAQAAVKQWREAKA